MRAPKIDDLPKSENVNPTAKYGHVITIVVGLVLIVLKHAGVIDTGDAAWLVQVLDYVIAALLAIAVAFLGLDVQHAKTMEKKIDDEVRKQLPTVKRDGAKGEGGEVEGMIDDAERTDRIEIDPHEGAERVTRRG